ncbi:hypothetical protein PsorP6_015857 [Peronosclerospora sorghi]|uniref:Uncharacterized protein n=1 Tax=Peronosclerospora sorghi TaxID=230839 RepID=A0ACC0WQ79_9STRA|nr:hypothetical protein PsorP6_015857 [Peronosclerospora sorghi]
MTSLAPTATAHQVLLLPNVFYTTQDKDTQYNPLAFLEDQGFKTQEDFTAWYIQNGYKSLMDFMDRGKYTVTAGADHKCGFTNPNAPPQPIPAGNAVRSTGYTHDGPCAYAINDKVVFEDKNCHNRIPGKDFTIDYSSCQGICLLRWFWLGVRHLKGKYSWQIYKACVPLTTNPAPPPSRFLSNATFNA